MRALVVFLRGMCWSRGSMGNPYFEQIAQEHKKLATSEALARHTFCIFGHALAMTNVLRRGFVAPGSRG